MKPRLWFEIREEGPRAFAFYHRLVSYPRAQNLRRLIKSAKALHACARNVAAELQRLATGPLTVAVPLDPQPAWDVLLLCWFRPGIRSTPAPPVLNLRTMSEIEPDLQEAAFRYCAALDKLLPDLSRLELGSSDSERVGTTSVFEPEAFIGWWARALEPVIGLRSKRPCPAPLSITEYLQAIAAVDESVLMGRMTPELPPEPPDARREICRDSEMVISLDLAAFRRHFSALQERIKLTSIEADKLAPAKLTKGRRRNEAMHELVASLKTSKDSVRDWLSVAGFEPSQDPDLCKNCEEKPVGKERSFFCSAGCDKEYGQAAARGECEPLEEKRAPDPVKERAGHYVQKIR